ncbi:MAG TPA: hydrogenase small subunit [Candidatus Sulfotelmatobacter sp.]|nr:hydrogenase small subunit [Candidatus Sulfotelmatobacter sp.]
MSTVQNSTIAAHLRKSGVSRRSFLELCSKLMVAAPIGLALTTNRTAAQVAQLVGKSRRPSVIWLHFQDCTGCTETLLRTSAPDVAHLILDVISLDYHETLMAASGAQAEAALRSAIEENAGKFVLVIEGSIPAKDDGVFMELASKPAIQVAKDVASQAAAVIAIGSCASWGGVPSADPNPTGAIGVDSVISGKPIINLPGCPPNPYNLLAVVLEYVTMGRLPEVDDLRRPKFAYDRVIHENCPRRAHFDAGRFAFAFGDEGHRKGWCLYKLGCKGPVTHAACATRHFNEIPGVWPIGTGVPCVGCTEKNVVWKMSTFETAPIHLATPPETYPPIYSTAGGLKVGAAALVGAIAGAVSGAAWVASQRFQSSTEAGVARVSADIAHLERLRGKTNGEPTGKKED